MIIIRERINASRKMIAAEALAGRDAYCMNNLEACRAGRFD